MGRNKVDRQARCLGCALSWLRADAEEQQAVAWRDDGGEVQ